MNLPWLPAYTVWPLCNDITTISMLHKDLAAAYVPVLYPQLSAATAPAAVEASAVRCEVTSAV
jgi:hypothetical protein